MRAWCESMNILIHRYNSICEPDFIAAFQALGLQVIEDREEMKCKEISAKERMSALGRQILEHRPLFVFSINYFPYIALLCEKLHVLYVAVSVDCPVAELFDESIRSPYNRVFLFDRQQYLSIREENPGCIFHLPLGVNVERIDETIGSFERFAESPGYDYDISFVGSLYREKDEYRQLCLADEEKTRLDHLMEEQRPQPGLALLDEKMTEREVEAIRRADPGFYSSRYSVRDIGRFWAIDLYAGDHLTSLDRVDLLTRLADAEPERQVHLFTRSDSSGMGNVVCHGGVNSLTEMPLVFRRSRINLNPTMRAIRAGLPQRIWDVLGSGGFLLSNAQEEIPDYLEIGKHLDVYETTAELIEKTGYWLTHEEQRQEIACAGYTEVRKHHTVSERVSQMIRVVYSTMGSEESV